VKVKPPERPQQRAQRLETVTGRVWGTALAQPQVMGRGPATWQVQAKAPMLGTLRLWSCWQGRESAPVTEPVSATALRARRFAQRARSRQLDSEPLLAGWVLTRPPAAAAAQVLVLGAAVVQAVRVARMAAEPARSEC
jgi:hypothetical protein